MCVRISFFIKKKKETFFFQHWGERRGGGEIFPSALHRDNRIAKGGRSSFNLLLCHLRKLGEKLEDSLSSYFSSSLFLFFFFFFFPFSFPIRVFVPLFYPIAQFERNGMGLDVPYQLRLPCLPPFAVPQLLVIAVRKITKRQYGEKKKKKKEAGKIQHRVNWKTR